MLLRMDDMGLPTVVSPPTILPGFLSVNCDILTLSERFEDPVVGVLVYDGCSRGLVEF